MQMNYLIHVEGKGKSYCRVVLGFDEVDRGSCRYLLLFNMLNITKAF